MQKNISGVVDEEDQSFHSALYCELRAEYELIPKQLYLIPLVYIMQTREAQLGFVVYFGTYLNGEFYIMDSDQCTAYRFFI